MAPGAKQLTLEGVFFSACSRLLIYESVRVYGWDAGAKQVTLEGVFHSPLGAAAGRSWYGSEDVIDRWVHEIWRDADELAGGGGCCLNPLHSCWRVQALWGAGSTRFGVAPTSWQVGRQPCYAVWPPTAVA